MKPNLILALFVFILFIFVSCNDDFTVEAPFKPGDKVYLDEHEVTDTLYKEHVEDFYIKLRPLKDTEVDNMDIDLSEKELIKRNLSIWDKSYMYQGEWGISIDSLCKFKTACIGTFVRAVSTNIKTDDGFESSIFYQIKPNEKACSYDVVYGAPGKIPETYTKDEDESSSYFIKAYSVTGTESKRFRKVQD